MIKSHPLAFSMVKIGVEPKLMSGLFIHKLS